jgi:hypothetical protein
MNCSLCESIGVVKEAVAVCQECGAAACQDHFDDAILAARPQILHRPECSHAAGGPSRQKDKPRPAYWGAGMDAR